MAGTTLADNARIDTLCLLPESQAPPADACLDEDRFAVRTESRVRDALAVLFDPQRQVDCLVVAADLPAGDGLALVEAVREHYPALPVVFLGDADTDAVEAFERGVTARLRVEDLRARPDLFAARIEAAVAHYWHGNRTRNDPEPAVGDATGGTALWALEDGTVTVSPGVEVFGYEPDVPASDCEWWLDRVHPEDRERVREAFDADPARAPVARSVGCRVERADGTYADVRWAGVALDGEAAAFVGTVAPEAGADRDQTLSFRAALLEAQAETTLDGLLVVDDDRTVLYHNDRFLDMWEIPEAVAAERSDREMLAYVDSMLADPEAFYETVEYLYEHPGETSRDTIRLTDDRWFERYSAPVTGRDGTYYGRLWMFRDVTERKERERKLQRQREELTQLNRLNTLVREINDALQDETTRDGIERAVCNRLVDSALYQAAWVGVSDDQAGDRAVVPRTSAGVDDAYLDGIPDCEPGPAWRALDTGEVQVVSDVASAADFPDVRRGIALDYGHHALATVPLTTGDATHGVLVVYAPEGHDFDEQEQSVLGDFGGTIARAIQRVHSQRSLTADTAVELDFRVRDDENLFGAVSADLDCDLELDRRVPAAAGADIYYVEVSGAGADRVADRLAESPLVERCTVVTDADADRVEAVRADRSDVPALPLDVFVDHGASIETARAAGGDLRYSVTAPPEMSVRSLREALADVAPSVELAGKRLVDQPVTTVPEVKDAVRAQLTPKQEAAVETAYARGYYEWPRTSTAEEVADVLDVSASTLHYHLRRAHRTVLAALFEEYDDQLNQ